jgi:hypothetical protein
MTSEEQRRDAATTAVPDVMRDAAQATGAPDDAVEATPSSGGSTGTTTGTAIPAEATMPAEITIPAETMISAETAMLAETAMPAETMMRAETAMPATGNPAAPALEASDATPLPLDARDATTALPQEAVSVRDSLEAIKTAVVWLVVLQILTILSPLLRVSLKWALIVGVVLSVGSFAVAVLAYLKAQRAQRGLPE